MEYAMEAQAKRARVGEVFAQLDRAESLAKELADEVGGLVTRLDPVSTPSEPENEASAIRERKLSGAVAQRLSEHNDFLESLTRRLRMQLDRLEL